MSKNYFFLLLSLSLSLSLLFFFLLFSFFFFLFFSLFFVIFCIPKGNVASTWESLLDHRKLPFMAMLRNLRNLIMANVGPKYHDMVLRKLTDQRSVINRLAVFVEKQIKNKKRGTSGSGRAGKTRLHHE